MSSPATILVIDDNEINRRVLNDFVIMLGHVPVLAEDGRTGLEQLDACSPDLVLLDIMMPGMDGRQVLDRIMAEDRWRTIPVIMITAIDDFQSAVNCIEKGADDYLTKPFNPVFLKARVSACLEKKRLRDRERQLHQEVLAKHAALQETTRARDALANMIVHDLNGPLTSVVGFTELARMQMQADPPPRDKILSALDTIAACGNEMTSLVKGILDVTRFEAGEMPVSLTSVDAGELVETLVERALPAAAKAGIEICLEGTREGMVVRADRELLTRAIDNLIGNALKHSPSGCRVTLSLTREREEIVLAVSDNGPGIPEEYVDRVFEKFVQVDARNKGTKYGVGLGLTFCHMAMGAQGGRIWVESAEGEGSTFSIALKAEQN